MAEYLLCAIITLSLASIYVSRQKRSTALFEIIGDWYILFVALHACYALIVRYLFAEYAFAGLIAPFGLLYGPFFFFAIKSLSDDQLNKKSVIIHAFPAVLFWLLFLIVVISGQETRAYLLSYYAILYAVTSVSLIGYAIWGVLSALGDGFSELPNYTQGKKQVLKASGYVLIVMSGLFTIIIASDIVTDNALKVQLPGMIVYSGMLISIVFAFSYKVKKNQDNVTNAVTTTGKISRERSKQEPAEIPLAASPQKYVKSGLTVEMFEDYKARLDKSFDIDKAYLNSELNLEKLGRMLKIPAHHLTQLFNVYLGENFNQYMNKYRIKNAALLLENNVDGLSMEEIAFRSGFNNKVSFNRHFKSIMECTPKEYAVRTKK